MQKKKPIVQCTDVVMQFKNTTYEHILNVEKAYLGVVSGANIKHMGSYIAVVSLILQARSLPPLIWDAFHELAPMTN